NFNVYAFILSSDTPSLFKNESDEEKLDGEKSDDKKKDKQEDDKKKDKKKSDEDKDKKADPTKVDFKNIAGRIIALPLRPGYYTLDGSTDKKLTYRRGREIGVYDLEKLEDKTLIEN